MADLIIGVKRMHSVEGSEIDEATRRCSLPRRRVTARRRSAGGVELSPPPGSSAGARRAGPQSGQLPQPRPLWPTRLGGGHVEYARPAEGEAHADAAALEGDDEYSRLRAAASVFVELQEEEEHSFKSLLEKEVL